MEQFPFRPPAGAWWAYPIAWGFCEGHDEISVVAEIGCAVRIETAALLNLETVCALQLPHGEYVDECIPKLRPAVLMRRWYGGMDLAVKVRSRLLLRIICEGSPDRFHHERGYFVCPLCAKTRWCFSARGLAS